MTKLTSALSSGVRIGAFAAALTVTPFAQAQYRLSVFEGAIAHDALKSSNILSAEAAFEAPAKNAMDYADLNNLCVLQIVERDIEEATSSCRRALKQIRHLSIKSRERRQTQAVVLTNLSVALALEGRLTAAEDAIEKALILDSDNEEALINQIALSRVEVALR